MSDGFETSCASWKQFLRDPKDVNRGTSRNETEAGCKDIIEDQTIAVLLGTAFDFLTFGGVVLLL